MTDKAESMRYDDAGNVRCPECSGVDFYLRLECDDPRPIMQCQACDTRLRIEIWSSSPAALH